MEDDKIVMIMDDGSEAEFTVLDETVLAGSHYILVTDAPDDEDGECYIFKDVSEPDDEEAVYESIADDEEAEAVYALFREQMKDEIDIEH